MPTNTPKSDAPILRTRLMVEHVDRRGTVSLLPLTPETQLLIAANIPLMPRSIRRRAPRNDNPVKEPEMPGKSATLTARETQVFDLLVAGLSTKKIAFELIISPRTVEIHRSHLMRKMGVRNLAALVRKALTAPNWAA